MELGAKVAILYELFGSVNQIEKIKEEIKTAIDAVNSETYATLYWKISSEGLYSHEKAEEKGVQHYSIKVGWVRSISKNQIELIKRKLENSEHIDKAKILEVKVVY